MRRGHRHRYGCTTRSFVSGAACRPDSRPRMRVRLRRYRGCLAFAVAQAGLPAKAGGLSLLPASSLWAVARLAGAMAVRPYLIEHADAFCLPLQAPSRQF